MHFEYICEAVSRGIMDLNLDRELDTPVIFGVLAVLNEEQARVRAGLEKLSDVEILTPAHPGLCAAMITFRSPRVTHDKLFSRLLSEHKMRARPVTEENLNAVRVSLHLMNSPAECDGLVAGVAAILKKA